MQRNYDISIIINFVSGCQGCGKTSLINKFINGKFTQHYHQTQSAEFKQKIIERHDKNVQLLIWDTTSKPKYKQVIKIYNKNSRIVIFLFDLTDKQSFDNIKVLIKQYHQQNNCVERIGFLVGSKSDLLSQRKVSYNQANWLGNLIGRYYQTSAKNGQNINTLFYEAVDQYYKLQQGNKGIKSLQQGLSDLQKQLNPPPQSFLRRVFNAIFKKEF